MHVTRAVLAGSSEFSLAMLMIISDRNLDNAEYSFYCCCLCFIRKPSCSLSCARAVQEHGFYRGLSQISICDVLPCSCDIHAH